MTGGLGEGGGLDLRLVDALQVDDGHWGIQLAFVALGQAGPGGIPRAAL